MMERKAISGDYPYNLLIGVRGRRMLEFPPSLTKDVQAGISYALFTLEDAERNVLDKKYRLGVPLSDDQQKIEKKALKKLCYPSRWDYIRYGIVGCTKKKAEDARRKGYTQGYREGYSAGLKTQGTDREVSEIVDMMDLTIETMPLSSRVCNALRSNGCTVIRDVATQNIATIRKMRNLGEKGIQEILQALHSYGLTHTEWELF